MKKIKKVFMSIGIFFTTLITKVSAVQSNIETKYGVFDPRTIEDKYGVFDPGIIETKYGVFDPEPTAISRIFSIGKFVVPAILFVIGIFVILNKKLTNKVKAIIVSILVVAAIAGYAIMNYIATNY